MKELFSSKLLVPSPNLSVVMMSDQHESNAKDIEKTIPSSVHECAKMVSLNPEIIQRSQQIERGLKHEGRRIQGSLELEEGIIKPLIR
jgi:hypothetical protein